MVTGSCPSFDGGRSTSNLLPKRTHNQSRVFETPDIWAEILTSRKKITSMLRMRKAIIIRP
jgi:hypothetical protein